MTTRTMSLWLDALMLVVFASLMSWRFTGVPIHEWAATALLVILLVHLVIHWHWIETRVARLRRGPPRTRANVLLNLSLFAAMGVALVSGFIISKVMFPNVLSPGDYLRWHGLHEGAATITLVILGLHVALNWDLIASGVRRIWRRSAAVLRPTTPTAGVVPVAHRPRWSRRFAFIAAGILVIIVATRALGAAMPAEGKILLVTKDGHQTLVDPPPELSRLHDGDDVPVPARGGARFVLRFAMLGAVAVAGRKVLRLRLS